MKLTTEARKQIPGGQFAGPNRSFPIADKSHARAALSMAHYASNPGAIRAAVHAKYPSIGKAGHMSGFVASVKHARKR